MGFGTSSIQEKDSWLSMVYTMKLNPNGSLAPLKARLVAIFSYA